jgi:hypothetical protein
MDKITAIMAEKEAASRVADARDGIGAQRAAGPPSFDELSQAYHTAAEAAYDEPGDSLTWTLCVAGVKALMGFFRNAGT